MAGRVARKRALGRPQFGDLKFLMIGFGGRHQWRRQPSFKLRAKPALCEKNMDHSGLDLQPFNAPNRGQHPKFAIRSMLVRRTIIVQEFVPRAQFSFGSVGIDRPSVLRRQDKVE